MLVVDGEHRQEMTVGIVEVAVNGHLLHLVRQLPDRRPSSSDVPRPINTAWLVQAEVERALYGNHKPNGAFSKLLKRTPRPPGVPFPLVLRSRQATTTSGIMTDEEWTAVTSVLHAGVRSFSLVPQAFVEATLGVFGQTEASVAIVDALGIEAPSTWKCLDEDGALPPDLPQLLTISSHGSQRPH